MIQPSPQPNPKQLGTPVLPFFLISDTPSIVIPDTPYLVIPNTPDFVIPNAPPLSVPTTPGFAVPNTPSFVPNAPLFVIPEGNLRLPCAVAVASTTPQQEKNARHPERSEGPPYLPLPLPLSLPALVITLALTLFFVLPKENLPLLLLSPLVLLLPRLPSTSHTQKKTSSSRPERSEVEGPAAAVASRLIKGLLLSPPAVASIFRSIPRQRPLKLLLLPILLAPTAAPAATRKKPPSTHHTAPKSKPSHAKTKPKTKHRPNHFPTYQAPDNALAALPRPLPNVVPNPFTNPHALDPFFQALALHQSQSPDSPDAQSSVPSLAATVRILQFGDSHTAADLFTGSLRALLQSRFGNGGLGFQFPGHPFPGYHLAGSTRSQTSGWFTEGNRFTQLGDGNLGLGGIALSTSRPGESVSLTTTCTTMQVHFLRQPGGGRLRFTDNGTFIADLATGNNPPLTRQIAPESSPRSPEDEHISAETSPFYAQNIPETAAQTAPGSGLGSRLGTEPGSDSGIAPGIAPGSLTYACTQGEHTFTLTTQDRAPVRLLGLITEQPGITYECLGINGAVAPLMLRWNQALFAEYLRQRAPALIVLAYGTNEAAQSPASNDVYVTQFHRLLQNLHRIVPTAAILVLGPYDRAMRSGRGRRARWQTFSGTDRIIAGQKAACRIDNCAFYDERTRMGGPGSMIRWASTGLAQPDRTHLTGLGYRTLAEALFRDLMAAFVTSQQTPTPNLTHPSPQD